MPLNPGSYSADSDPPPGARPTAISGVVDPPNDEKSLMIFNLAGQIVLARVSASMVANPGTAVEIAREVYEEVFEK